MGVHTTHADVEERPLFLPATGLLSYRVHLEYDGDSLNWVALQFDLLEEVQPPGKRLSYRPVSFAGYRPDAPGATLGLSSLIVADLCCRDVEDIIVEAIRADIAVRRERAAEERAERRRRAA